MPHRSPNALFIHTISDADDLYDANTLYYIYYEVGLFDMVKHDKIYKIKI